MMIQKPNKHFEILWGAKFIKDFLMLMLGWRSVYVLHTPMEHSETFFGSTFFANYLYLKITI